MKCVKYFKRQSQHFNFYCHLSPVSAKKILTLYKGPFVA